MTGGVFIHVHKCGGTSLKEMLFPHDPKKRIEDVYTLSFGTTKYGGRYNYAPRCGIPNFYDRYKFAIIRNPFDRLVSAYRYFCNGVSSGGARFTFKGPFSEFVKWAIDPKMPVTTDAHGPQWQPRLAAKMHTAPYGSLCYYLHSADFIGRYEHYSDSVRTIFEQLNQPMPELVYTNVSRRRDTPQHYSSYYTPKDRELATRYYCDDLDRFGYTFEEV
jgi:hypothetical protein